MMDGCEQSLGAWSVVAGRAVGVIAMGLGGLVLGGLGGCADDVGHSKTTTKSTTETPNGKVTTTEVHEKDTTVTPR